LTVVPEGFSPYGFETIGLEINKELSSFIGLIDENFIRSQSNDIEDYKNKLSKLKNNFEELLILPFN